MSISRLLAFYSEPEQDLLLSDYVLDLTASCSSKPLGVIRIKEGRLLKVQTPDLKPPALFIEKDRDTEGVHLLSITY
ncbi:hypothetical protein Baya_1430 [Bagarius yarrelli]|uniref:Uncharacterized protein n=1 Tax=Bagarius yarrelli TaxID=175774 RepID=A0A556TL42_BAGYA|nr:hypothetical protein Baya_1430 [Bagarius yarrelli]